MYGWHSIGTSVSFPSESYQDWVVKHNGFWAHCDNNLRQRKPINNPAVCRSHTIQSSDFPSIQAVWIVCGGTCHDPSIVDWITRHITVILLVISTLSFLHSMLQFIYSTLIHISFSHSCNFFIVITRHLFKSLQDAAALLLLLHILAAAWSAHYLFTTTISMVISALYPTITLIMKRTILNPTTCLLTHHPGMQCASGHRWCFLVSSARFFLCRTNV